MAASSSTGPIIGMTAFQNGITLDNAKVTGTATLFDGSTIQSEGFSRIHLNNGTRLDFAAGSKAQVFANHAALSTGMTEMETPSKFEIDTTALRIQSTESNSIARVKIDSKKSDRVYVTALNAPVSVLDKQGMLVAKVMPGLPMQFMPQAGGGQAAGAAPPANSGSSSKNSGGFWNKKDEIIIGIAAAAAAGIGGAAAAGAFATPSP
jgi:hypothetical protein